MTNWYKISKLFPAVGSRLLGAQGPNRMYDIWKCKDCGSRWIDPTFCICQKCGAINRHLDRNRTYGISNDQWQRNVDEAMRQMEGKRTPLSDMPPWESK